MSDTFIDDKGYRRFSDSKRLVHRWVVRQSGQHLRFYHQVHHIDRNKLNNDISNLQVVTPEEHERIHGREFNNSYSTNYKSRHFPYGRYSSKTRMEDDYDISEYNLPLIGIILILIGVAIALFGLFGFISSVFVTISFIILVVGGILASFGYLILKLVNK